MKNDNNNYNEKKKKFMGKIVFGLLPSYIVKKNKNCIAILDFVLQRFRLERLKLYCKINVVLQH